MIPRYLIPSVTALTIAACIFLGTLFPTSLFPLLAFSLLAAVLAISLLGRTLPLPTLFLFATSPLILVLSSGLFLFTEALPQLTQLMLLAVVSFFLGFGFMSIWVFAHEPATYPPYTLEYYTRMVNTLSLFFLAASAFTFSVALGSPLWLLALVLGLFSVVLSFQSLRSSHAPVASALHVAIIIGLLVAELSVSLSFLPTRPLISAFPLVVFFLVALECSRRVLLESLSRVFLIRYLSLGFTLVIVVLSTAKWI